MSSVTHALVIRYPALSHFSPDTRHSLISLPIPMTLLIVTRYSQLSFFSPNTHNSLISHLIPNTLFFATQYSSLSHFSRENHHLHLHHLLLPSHPLPISLSFTSYDPTFHHLPLCHLLPFTTSFITPRSVISHSFPHYSPPFTLSPTS